MPIATNTHAHDVGLHDEYLDVDVVLEVLSEEDTWNGTLVGMVLR